MPEQDDVFQRAMDYAPISMQIQDRNGLTVRVNNAFLALFGYRSRVQVEGKLNVRTNPVIAAQGQLAYIERAYAGEIVHSQPSPYRSINGREMVVQSTFVPTFGDGGTVDNVVIFHEDVSALTESQRNAEHRAQLLTSLQDAHRGIADRLRVNEVLEAVMDAAQTVIGAGKVAIWEVNLLGEWTAVAQRGLSAAYGAELTKLNRNSPLLRARSIAVTREMRPLTYSLDDPDHEIGGYNAFLEREHVRRVLTVPLLSGTTVTGTLTFYRSSSADYEPILVETACLLADQAAIALHNARLFEEISAIRDRLEDRVRESTERLEAAHREALDNEKLAAVGFLAKEVAHGLRNPLNVISASAYYLKLRCPREDEKVARHFDAISRAIAQAADTVSDMITLASGPQPSLADLNVNSLVRQAVEERDQTSPGLLVVSLADNLPSIRGDWTQLLQAVRSLIANAIAARKSESVSITTTLEGEAVVVSIGDDRPAMSQSEIENAFGPFATSATHWTGLGLSVARQIIESHGGHARVVVREGRTWFQLEIPIHTVAAAQD